MKEENSTYFSSLFLYSGLLMFYQVKTETFDDLLMLDDERLDKSKLFFPLEIGLQHD
ncbi:MAG TPA: hypothetical protein PKM63_02260 [Panacibacter sp.]|nr:hypothetical protein [Panacibacter sp.]HNP43078.1 hypothetical protein [Panacibacter sp.]